MSKSKEINQNNDQALPEEPLAEVVHRLPAEEWELEQAHLSKEKVIDFIRQVQEHPTFFTTNLALDLEKVGLLSELEEAGVLPLSPARADFA
jgi:hypothetical protein